MHQKKNLQLHKSRANIIFITAKCIGTAYKRTVLLWSYIQKKSHNVVLSHSQTETAADLLHTNCPTRAKHTLLPLKHHLMVRKYVVMKQFHKKTKIDI